jgi:hypothetical protein
MGIARYNFNPGSVLISTEIVGHSGEKQCSLIWTRRSLEKTLRELFSGQKEHSLQYPPKISILIMSTPLIEMPFSSLKFIDAYGNKLLITPVYGKDTSHGVFFPVSIAECGVSAFGGEWIILFWARQPSHQPADIYRHKFPRR